jgi:hypothetical protein
MIKQTIGENAGLIWRHLNENGEMQLVELQQISGIDEADFNRSLGWLARENKVGFYEEDGKEIVALIS